jgi:butyryl-CoA dehydrogenase
MPIVDFGSDDQMRRFLRPMAEGRMLSAVALTEARGGSDAAAMTASAVRDGDQYLLNGTKQFITSGKNADVAIIFARTGASGAKDGISAFIAPTGVKGCTVLRVESKLGQRASDTCEIVPNGVRVPVENRLGQEGEGLLIALSNLQGGRIASPRNRSASLARPMRRRCPVRVSAWCSERRSSIIRRSAFGLRRWRPALRPLDRWCCMSRL